MIYSYNFVWLPLIMLYSIEIQVGYRILGPVLHPQKHLPDTVQIYPFFRIWFKFLGTYDINVVLIRDVEEFYSLYHHVYKDMSLNRIHYLHI